MYRRNSLPEELRAPSNHYYPGLSVVYKALGEDVKEALKDMDFPCGWHKVIGEASILFSPVSKPIPCIKVTWDRGIKIETQTMANGQIKSSTRSLKTQAALAASLEMLLALHDC